MSTYEADKEYRVTIDSVERVESAVQIRAGVAGVLDADAEPHVINVGRREPALVVPQVQDHGARRHAVSRRERQRSCKRRVIREVEDKSGHVSAPRSADLSANRC